MATTTELLRLALDAVDAAERRARQDDGHIEVCYQCGMAQEALVKALRAVGKPYTPGAH